MIFEQKLSRRGQTRGDIGGYQDLKIGATPDPLAGLSICDRGVHHHLIVLRVEMFQDASGCSFDVLG
jgi:hypothetical protein